MTGLHIHAPKGLYHPQVRGRGCRTWQAADSAIEAYDDKALAASIAVKAMIDGGHKRARVLFCAEWYDPIVVMEASV
jgi:hypothetical protein